MDNPKLKRRLESLPRPVAVVMSSGFFGFFAHAGFLQGLADLGLEPDAYAGSSSGAMAAAFAAAGRSPQEMLDGFSSLRKKEFWDPPRGARLIRHALARFKNRSGYLEGKAFLRALEESLPVSRFEDCRKPCLVSTLDLVSNQRVIISKGPLAPAVAASGTVPILFSAAPLGGMLLVDGGMVDKAPLLAAVEHLGAASIIMHLIPSSSLMVPLTAMLAKAWAPLRLQSRAIDAARQQNLEDQLAWVRGQGVQVIEVRNPGLIRPGPRRLDRGPRAFAQARESVGPALRLSL